MTRTTDTEAHKAFCTEYVSAREKYGITQTAIAERLGVHQSLIARIESGSRRVDIIEYIALCHAAGIDPAAFLASFAGFVPPDHQIGEDKRR